jgi:hypothetical protein
MMANNAFDAMNNAAGTDMYITGGAISMSEYEHNMTPEEQKKYETMLMDEFMSAYNSDPYKGDLDFKHWLKTLNLDLVRERALKYEDIKAENNGLQKLMTMENGRLLEDAGTLQTLAHLHTGRLEDITEIVSGMDPGISPMEQSQFRRPPGMPAPNPQPGLVPESPYEGGGDQGPF